MAARFLSFIGLVAYAAAECPNACSGHGEGAFFSFPFFFHAERVGV